MTADNGDGMSRQHLSPAQYERTIRQADGLIAEQKWAKAIGCLSKILCRRLRDVPAAVRRMNIYAEIGEYGAAVSDASNILKWCPGERQALRTRGMLRFLAGNYEQAIEDVQAALAHDPHDRELLVAWAEAKSRLAESAYHTAATAAAEGKVMSASWWHTGKAPAESAIPVRAVGSAFVIAMDPAAWPSGVTASLQVRFDRPEAPKTGAEPKGTVDAVDGPATDAGR